jgi:hypothetical protein
MECAQGLKQDGSVGSACGKNLDAAIDAILDAPDNSAANKALLL